MTDLLPPDPAAGQAARVPAAGKAARVPPAGQAAQLPAAEAAAARLPPLLLAADRVAATVAQGVHGRRRVGVGDSFWQYRPFVTGDAAARIDWRRSARSDRLFVRDTEWEAAQTACLWRDASASMAWRGARDLPEKKERAELLLLALASLLFRAGEMVRPLGAARPVTRAGGLAALAALLPAETPALPSPDRVPAHAQIVLISDFLQPLPEIEAALLALADRRARLHLLQVLDPAEYELPFDGRVRFRGLEREGEALIPRVSSVRTAYAAALAAHLDGLARIASRAGAMLIRHRTDHAPDSALLASWQALDARGARA